MVTSEVGRQMITHPDEEAQKAHVVETVAAGGYTDCRYDNQYKLDAVETGSTIKVGEKAKQ